ncbi:MAG: LuxR C-terminal-related transcriptional regulator [Thermomicrobiales bacterium]
MARLNESACPATLILAPAGFGKTTLAASWASQDATTAWLTADVEDASLKRFWAHMHAALGPVAPGLGELVESSLQIPYRAPAAELGRILADELADHGERVQIVIDDIHQIPLGEVHDFLIGLLELAPPSLRLVLTARSAPPLSLNRLRLRGQLNEIGSEDLLFNREEVRAFLAQAGPDTHHDVTGDAAERVWRRTGGWAAGLRLMHVGQGGELPGRASMGEVPALDDQLLDPLLEETLSSFAPAARQVLLRAALPERCCASLVQAIGGDSSSHRVTREVLQLARNSGISRRLPHLGAEWFEFHPLFRELLLRHLEHSETPPNLAALHTRAAEWFAANGMYDAAIVHRLAAGDAASAAALVECQVQPALAREDWPNVARWLDLLPRELVESEPRLLLARGWMLHVHGLARQLAEIPGNLERSLDVSGVSPADAEALRAEAMLIPYVSLVPFQMETEGTLATVQGLAARLTPAQVFAAGIAQTAIGFALHTSGRTRDAVAHLEGVLEAAPTPIDAAAARPLIGLLWIRAQSSHVADVAAIAQATYDLTERNGLRLSAGWARRFLGDTNYEQNALDQAMAHYTAIVQDHDFSHLAAVREALFGLALVYVAQGRDDDAWRSLRRAREIMVGADALEHLALLEAYTAYLALMTGDHGRAVVWARNHMPDVDSAPLFLGMHPTVVRATILVAAGDEAEMASAITILEEVAHRCARGNYGATLARVNALLSLAMVKQGNTRRAIAIMRESLEGGTARGFTRTYLDLLPLFGPQLRALATHGLFPPAIQAAITAHGDAPDGAPTTSGAAELLTEREREVLASLFQRLSYKEIAEKLYISPATVKRHASSIYSKLGVSGRTEAIRAAQGLGWQAS